MPAPPQYYAPNKLAAAKPTRKIFDAWNTSSKGHQHAENRLSGSTSWRDSRNLKLAEQFAKGHSGGKRMADTVGAGSENYGLDGRLENGSYVRGASGLREKGQQSLVDCMKPKTVKISTIQGQADGKEHVTSGVSLPSRADGEQCPAERAIFRNLVFYVNGSTYPTVSDHKLKRLLAEHGARSTVAFGRRSVTHVILGTPNHCASKKGAGGGLAGSKIDKEIVRGRGRGIKFVSAEWVLESIRANTRLPEARFSELKLAAKGQKSVYEMASARQPQKETTGA